MGKVKTKTRPITNGDIVALKTDPNRLFRAINFRGSVADLKVLIQPLDGKSERRLVSECELMLAKLDKTRQNLDKFV